ncbi:type III polyketide synthase [Actinomadura miaoliensis]|uniref:Type III polyketide synthase n=1 Tax=Actinomadura miaoliensis TaxID=430685 RepID=A0ABP7V0T9_9ACTN
MPSTRIVDISFCAPPLMPTEEFAKLFATDVGGDDVARVVRNSAIDTKGMAVNPFAEDPRWWPTRERMDRGLLEARSLATEAIALALGRAGLRPDEIGFLATVTTTTHSAPGLDALAPAMGMRDDTATLSLGPMGCYAALPALSACRDWVETHRRPAVLLAVDLFSPHLQPPPYDKEKAVCLTLFGDGAAAVVLTPDGDGADGMEIVDTQQLTVPAHADDLQVHVGDLGMYIRLAPTMPEVVAAAVRGPVDALLARNRLDGADVTWWAVHPGGRRIIDRVGEVCDVPETSLAASRAVMRDYGNTAAPAVLGVLENLQKSRPLGRGEHGVAMAFGPGATVCVMLLRGA